MLVGSDEELPAFDARNKEYVDLGLPSGTLWATMNTGARSETDYGQYYRWGNGSVMSYDKTNGNYTVSQSPLPPSKDTATLYYSGTWHTPTYEQIKELNANTTFTWETNFKGSGINGGKFTAANGNYIFLPAAGYKLSADTIDVGNTCKIWSSTLKNASYAWVFQCRSGVTYIYDSAVYNTTGLPIRPVIEPMWVDLDLPSGTLWARFNIGARMEHEYGNYFQYGQGDAVYDTTQTIYNGTENPLSTTVDTAYKYWGTKWAMPTQEQLQELIANTTYQWVTNFNNTGINGGKFTATNGNYIFIPAAGYYDSGNLYYVGEQDGIWSATPCTSSRAYTLSCYSWDAIFSDSLRKYGLSVRPVTTKDRWL